MFDGIFDAIEEWMRELLTGMIHSNLDRMFTDVNQKTSEIAAQVGQTPQGWNGSIFSMIQNLSNSVIMPIAGIIITFVLCYELITMITERNNMHDSEISVDSKILDFLKMLYFGVTDNPFEAASRSAYTDMCRTIRFNGKNGDMLRKAVDSLLEERIPELVAVNDAEDFTKWHQSICEEIVSMYESEGIEFHIGQAQKWVNMTLKYLYVLVPDVVEPFYRFLHIPLDNYIIDIGDTSTTGCMMPLLFWLSKIALGLFWH